MKLKRIQVGLRLTFDVDLGQDGRLREVLWRAVKEWHRHHRHCQLYVFFLSTLQGFLARVLYWPSRLTDGI